VETGHDRLTRFLGLLSDARQITTLPIATRSFPVSNFGFWPVSGEPRDTEPRAGLRLPRPRLVFDALEGAAAAQPADKASWSRRRSR